MGIWPILALRVVSGRPLRMRLMSVLVPPMSMVTMVSAPTRSAKCAPAMTPPAGPDRTVWTGRARADSRVINPPEASITMIGLSRPTPRPVWRSRSRADSAPRYPAMTGVRKALRTVVLARSNSRNSREMSVEIETTTPGSCCSSTALASRSCAGLA